jgi:hypothetical protein
MFRCSVSGHSVLRPQGFAVLFRVRVGRQSWRLWRFDLKGFSRNRCASSCNVGYAHTNQHVCVCVSVCLCVCLRVCVGVCVCVQCFVLFRWATWRPTVTLRRRIWCRMARNYKGRRMRSTWPT